uniref:Col_cuticle_N domain-containing protein n=1 Tax=Heterorhabditis bacteriophora TaxID=37862 RepID=A0A1I7XIU4_HETBA
MGAPAGYIEEKLPHSIHRTRAMQGAKPMVLRLALPHVTLLLVSVSYAAFGGWILTIIKYSNQTTHYAEILERAKHNFTQFISSLNATRSSTFDHQFSYFILEVHNVYSKNPFSWNRNISY